MRKITQTIVGTTPPLDKNVLWLDTTNSNSPVEKVFLNGEWIPTSAAGGDYYTKDEVDENFMGKIDNPHVGNILVMDEDGKAVDSLTKPANFISNPEGGQEHAVLSLDSHGNPVWTPLTPGGDVIESEMKDDSDKAVQNGVIKKYVDNNCARKDGYYSQMTVGSAETLVGETVDSADYLIRPTGGESNEVANGVASVLGMEGNSQVWNQLIANNTYKNISGTITSGYLGAAISWNAISQHKYYIRVKFNSENITGYTRYQMVPTNTASEGSILVYPAVGGVFATMIFTPTSTGNKSCSLRVLGKNGTVVSTIVNTVNFIDLTLLGIDNLTDLADVEEWLAKHVGTKPYYAYNAGTILSAQTLGIKTYGQNLLNPTTRQAKLIPYEWEDNSNVYTIKNVPSANDLQITYTPDATGVAVTIYSYDSENPTPIPDSIDISDYGGSGVLYISAATAETYVCMKWDEGKDDDVVPFEEHTQTFDVRKVYGKVNGAGEYVQCYPNGMRGIGNVKDTLTASEAVVKIGSVDLGRDIMSWEYISSDNYVRISNTIIGIKKQTIAISSKYIYGGQSSSAISNGQFYVGNTYMGIKDSSISAEDVVNRTIAKLNDVELVYQLATPITYTDLIYRDGGIDRPLTDVLFNIEVNNWSIEEQLLTPYENGNPTAVPAKISTQYGMDAVEEIDTIKHTYVNAYNEQNFSDSQKAQARRNIGAVEEDGSYPNMSVGIAKNLAGENAVEAEYTYRQSNGTTGTNTGIANVTTVKGKTLKWNQLIALTNVTAYNSATIEKISGTNFWNVTTDGLNKGITFFGLYDIASHKYLIYFDVETTETVTLRIFSYRSYYAPAVDVNGKRRLSFLKTASSSNADERYGVQTRAAYDGTFKVGNPMCIDLTDLFGAGNEPSTVEEFEALYPLDYYAYTATPVLINNAASGIETTGFNQWDEEFEVGTYNSSTGMPEPSTRNIIRSKNPINVFDNTNYFAYNGTANYIRMFFYDNNMNFISSEATSVGLGSIITSPSSAKYCNIATGVDYGTTYNHDICINLSDSAKNGTYEPYEKHTFYFDKVLQSEGSLATIKGKLNGEGESVVVFPDGLRKAGNVFDEIKGNVAIKRIGVVDLGDLTWYYDDTKEVFYAQAPQDLKGVTYTYVANIICSLYSTVKGSGYNEGVDKSISINDIYYAKGITIKDSSYTDTSTFKTAMDGVKSYAELDTPETYILDQTVTGGYQVNALGTEKRLPEDTASAVNAPVNYSVIYPIDAVGTITKLPINYISEKSLTNFTTELASKLGTFLNATIGITATYNQTTQEYDYSITITSNE